MTVTNLAHIANVLHREATRLCERADYLARNELATGPYVDAVRSMGNELEEAGCCIDRYYQVRDGLSASAKRMLALPASAIAKRTRERRIGVAVFEFDGEEEPEEVNV